jgi:hypothetical protein
MDSNLIAIGSAGDDMIKSCGVVKAPATDLRFDFLFVLFVFSSLTTCKLYRGVWMPDEL